MGSLKREGFLNFGVRSEEEMRGYDDWREEVEEVVLRSVSGIEQGDVSGRYRGWPLRWRSWSLWRGEVKLGARKRRLAKAPVGREGRTTGIISSRVVVVIHVVVTNTGGLCAHSLGVRGLRQIRRVELGE